MTLTFQPVRVAIGQADEEGVLAFDGNQRLVAVLTHLSDENEVAAGLWYLEAGFGEIGELTHPIFPDLDEASTWITQRIAK